MRAIKVFTLVTLFLLVFSTRLFLLTENFTDDESYYVLRQVESIRGRGTPITMDPLSYGGKYAPVLPGHYYLMGAVRMFGSFFAFKVFPAIAGAIISIIGFFIAMEFTKQWKLAVISGYFAGFAPAFFKLTINSINNNSVVIALTFLTVLYLMRLEKTKKAFTGLIVCTILLTLVSPFSLILLGIFWVYAGFLKLQGQKIKQRSFEYLLFATFLILFINHLAFIKLGLESGISGIIFGSAVHTTSLAWIPVMGGVNIIILLLGVMGMYFSVKKEKGREGISLMISLGIGVILMGLFGAIKTTEMLSYLGIVLSITSVNSLVVIFDYLKKLKFAKVPFVLSFIIIIMIPVFLFGLYSSLTKLEIENQDIMALEFLGTLNNSYGATIAPIEYGHMITYFAKTKNVADTNLLNSPSHEKIIKDIKSAYTTSYETSAINIFDEYGVLYIFINDHILKDYNITKINYLSDGSCFEEIYNNGTKIYEVKCNLISI